MKECTLIIPRKNGRYGLGLKHKIHADGKVLAGSEEKWNGWGGKREEGDFSITHTAIREFWQEAQAVIFPWNLKHVARIDFHWPGDEPGKPTMRCYIYFIDFWIGSIKGGRPKDEMSKPTFFLPDEVPYDRMMKGDKVFLPRLIAGERFVANMYFDRLDERGLPTLEMTRNFIDPPLAAKIRFLLTFLWRKM